MTNITGDVLRAVADWYDRRPGTDVLVSRLRDDATKADVQVEQVDRLAKVYADAFAEPSNETDWDGAPDYWKDAHRAGVRAVLDALAEDRETALINYRRVQREPQQWDRIEDVPTEVKVVRNRWCDQMRREPNAAYGWRWIWDSGEDRCDVTHHYIERDCGPFTEIVDGAR